MWIIVRVTTVFLLCFTSTSLTAQEKPGDRCGFNWSTLRFKGTATEQAQCLLRPVERKGKVGSQLNSLPPPLNQLVGSPFKLEKAGIRRALKSKKIPEQDLGGSLDHPAINTSFSMCQECKPIAVQYFVIHDTSTPDDLTVFPRNINSADWNYNDLNREGYTSYFGPRVNVMTNRVGGSRTLTDFRHPRWLPATALESTEALKAEPALPVIARNVFLHVENVQPRILGDGCRTKHGCIAPKPGFTNPQYERLAWIYLAASARSGNWLIPAYHANIAERDDPKNFDLEKWSKAIEVVARAAGWADPK